MIQLPGNNRQPTLWQFGQWQHAKAWGLPALIASSGLPVDTYCLYLNFVSAAREGAETNLIKAWQAEQLCLKTIEICTCSKEIIIIMSFCLVLLNRRKKICLNFKEPALWTASVTAVTSLQGSKQFCAIVIKYTSNIFNKKLNKMNLR